MRFLFILLSLVVLVATTNSQYTMALPAEQKKLLNKGIYFYDAACTPSATAKQTTTQAGSGKPDGAIFPDLNPEDMASAVNKYIDKTNSSSKLNGLGDTIVAGAKNSNVSPFLIVAIAQKESGIADPGYGDGFNVRKANNSFGRTATESQPHVQGSKYLWYKWSTIKASVDHTAAENKDAKGGGDIAAYIRNMYADQLDSGDIAAFFKKYAPEFENDTEKYIQDVGKGVDEMVSLAKTGGSTVSEPSQIEDDIKATQDCCDTAQAAGDVSTSGSNNEQKVWNFLTGTMSFTPKQAAGIMGNIKQESGFSPTALNSSSGAYGIVQWYAGRKTSLETYADSKGKPASNIDIQFEFLKKELEGSYKTSVLDPIKASDSIENATLIWLERFEVPCLPGRCGGEMAIRLPFSQDFHTKYGNSSSSPAAINSDTPAAGSCDAQKNSEGSGTASGELEWPISKSEGMIFSCYGYSRGRLHTGIDIASPVGTTVVAADGGSVLEAGNIDPSGFGNTIIIKHPNGKFTLYAHLSSISVSKGDKVDQGQSIAKSGGALGAAGSGSSQGPHLHFNIQKQGGAGQGSIDPLTLLPKDGRAVNTAGGDCPKKATFS